MIFEDATKTYFEWIKNQGVNLNKAIEIADLRSKGQGRGVIALESIGEGEEIFSIPREIILNLENCSLAEERPDIKDDLHNLNQWEALIIVLLYEFHKEGESKWADYFKVLPIGDPENYTFNQLMFWNAEELEHLKPSLVLQRIGKELADGMYNKLFPKVVLDSMNLVQLKGTSPLDYHKIASLIMSYSFDVEKLGKNGSVDDDDDDDDDDNSDDDGENITVNQNTDSSNPGESRNDDNLSDDEFPDSLQKDSFLKSMIPLADTLNTNSNHHNATLEYVGDKLIVRATKPIEKNDQILNSYSDHPNSELLRRFGYIEPLGSKHDFGEVPLKNIQEYFLNCELKLTPKFWDETIDILKLIVSSEEEELDELVLDSYDCFSSNDIIIELIILLQCLTIVAAINSVNSMESLSYDSKSQLIKRIYHKCILLVESKKLTKNFLINYKRIIKDRMNEYPNVSVKEFLGNSHYSRTELAEVVLKSEYKSLESCLDIEKTFKTEDGSYTFIDDEKLIRNIIKRKFGLLPSDGDTPSSKKVKK